MSAIRSLADVNRVAQSYLLIGGWLSGSAGQLQKVLQTRRRRPHRFDLSIAISRYIIQTACRGAAR
jgi:hypothetical protein